jgi:hypothetical protein
MSADGEARYGAFMPRFLVERTFPGGLAVAANEHGAELWRRVVARNAEEGVTWLHSYVSHDRSRVVDVYEAEDAAAIRRAARLSELPVDSITPITVLDPFAFR